MNYLPIVPIGNLDILDNRSRVMVLAHLMENRIYFNYYHNSRNQRDWMLLDNGAAENSQVDANKLIEFTAELQPHTVIAPDTIGNGKETLKKTESFIPMLKKACPSVGIMAVPQGSTEEEYFWCFNKLCGIKEIEYIGISRFVSSTCFTDRCTCLHKMRYYDHLVNCDKKIHMLGCNNPVEVVYANRFQNIESIDSCLPVLYGLNKQLMPLDVADKHRIATPHDYFEQTLDEDQVQLAMDNIATMDMLTNLI